MTLQHLALGHLEGRKTQDIAVPQGATPRAPLFLPHSGGGGSTGPQSQSHSEAILFHSQACSVREM